MSSPEREPTENITATYLAKAAQKLSAMGGHGLARHLAASSREAAVNARLKEVPLPLRGKSCDYCAAVFVPGETSRTRIKPNRRRGRPVPGQPDSRERKNFVSVTCLLCGETTKLQGSAPAKKSSNDKKMQRASKEKAKHTAPPPPRRKNDVLKPESEPGFISLSAPKRKRKKVGGGSPDPPPERFQFQKFLKSSS